MGLENKQSIVCDMSDGRIPNICRLDTINNLIEDSEKEANALLISKSPQLLEALENAIKLLEATTEFDVLDYYINEVNKFKELVKQSTELK